MKNLLIVSITMLLFYSCTHDTFRVIKYSDPDSEKGNYYSFKSPKEEYYIVKGNNIYYVKQDTTIHFEKVTYLGRKGCYEKTIVKDNNGTKYLLDVYYDESTIEDKFVHITIIELYSNEETFSFVLDWQSRNKNRPIETRIVSSN